MGEATQSGIFCWPVHPTYHAEAQNYHAPHNGAQTAGDRRARQSCEWRRHDRQEKRMESQALEIVMNLCPQTCPKAAASDLSTLLKSHSYNEAILFAVNRIFDAGSPETGVDTHIHDAVQKLNGRLTSKACYETRERIGEDNAGLNRNRTGSSNSRNTTKGKEVIDLTLDSDEEINVEPLYQEWCIYRMATDFPRAPLSYLRAALTHFGGEFIKTYQDVASRYLRMDRSEGKRNSSLKIVGDDHGRSRGELTLLEKDREPRTPPNRECPRFEEDWRHLKMEILSYSEKIAVHCMERELEIPFEDSLSNPADDLDKYWDEVEKKHRDETSRSAPPEEALEECGCCYAELPFDKFVQVQKALPADACSKYEQRRAEYEVARAKIAGLVYCPFCNHPWEVDPGMIVLRCLNDKCKKASCLKCREPNHLPKDCAEVERASETAMRRKVEELMSKALIRECTKCHAELVKTDGCNKITCPCGQTMCYVCRKHISDYYHFCQHTRTAGQPCSECSGCLLWENEDEFEKVKVAKDAAIEEVAQQSAGILKRDIGPSEYNQNRKRRRNGWSDDPPQ